MAFELDMIQVCFYMLCEWHDMYMFMSLLHTEYAAHSSQPFFFRIVVDLFAGL